MKRHERSLARRCALQVLYQSELLDKPADIVVEEGLVPEDAGMGDYARCFSQRRARPYHQHVFTKLGD